MARSGALCGDYGVDGGDVLSTGKMSERINEYLKIALRTGQEVPASMKPMLQSMIDMGTLTDADGNKLTDLTKIPFAETMTQGFSRGCRLLRNQRLWPKRLPSMSLGEREGEA